LDRRLRTLTTLDRFGLVTWEGREPMLRMLQVDELRRAMGKIKMIGDRITAGSPGPTLPSAAFPGHGSYLGISCHPRRSYMTVADAE
jgi:hypothetical protein